MSQKFKPGDLVVLKSGGPRMTVSFYHDDHKKREWVNCVWFQIGNGINEPKASDFKEDVLEFSK